MVYLPTWTVDFCGISVGKHQCNFLGGEVKKCNGLNLRVPTSPIFFDPKQVIGWALPRQEQFKLILLHGLYNFLSRYSMRLAYLPTFGGFFMVNVYTPYTLSVWDKILFVFFTSFISFCRSIPKLRIAGLANRWGPTIPKQLGIRGTTGRTGKEAWGIFRILRICEMSGERGGQVDTCFLRPWISGCHVWRVWCFYDMRVFFFFGGGKHICFTCFPGEYLLRWTVFAS